MPLLLFVLFLAVPLVELVVIGQVSDLIGLGPTIVLLVADSLAGAYLVRREGRRAWSRFRAALDELRWPGDEVAQGALVLVGGALLVTPGFVTDLVGLAMVLPPTRRLVALALQRRVASRLAGRSGGSDGRPHRRRSTVVYDVEVLDVERDEPDPPSGDLPRG